MIEVERRVVARRRFAEGVGVVDFRGVRLVGSRGIWFRDFVGREEGSQVRLGDDDVFEARRVAGRPEAHITTFTGLELPIFPKVVPLEPQYYRSDTDRRNFPVVEDMFECSRHEHLRNRQDGVRRERRRNFGGDFGNNSLPFHDGEIAELGGYYRLH